MRGVLTLSVLAALIAILALGGYITGRKDTSSGKEVTVIITTLGKTSIERFDVTGFSALEVLESTHDVGTTSGYIKCIDDVCGGKEYHWLYYVNGRSVPKSSDGYQVKRGDIIEFRFGKR
ncbi:DUF4430 domain-containing protein [Candidatus Woesearchaeota archaeon]|nr:DUF4430 domain-containing protein [Candidatus Woesearchaeota archaeon]